MSDYIETRTSPLHESWKEREARSAALRRDAALAGVPVCELVARIRHLEQTMTTIKHRNQK